MIKFIYLLALILLSNSASSFETSGVNYEKTLRFFLKKDKWNHLAELSYEHRELENNSVHILVGSRFRVTKSIKLAVFIQNEYGIRHDEDRNVPAKTWLDTTNRSETSSIIEADYRSLLNFNTTIVFSLRTRYHHNFFNKHDLIRIRPSLSFFLNNNWNYFLRYEAYLPLNFSKETIYQHGIYFASSYKLSSHLSLGPSLSYKFITWNWEGAKQEHKSITLGISSNFYF